jgi:hypothetical protein
MARFYKTATPAFVDNKMFELPWQLMANTLMNKEKAVDTEIGEANSFLDKLTAQGLSPDQPRIKEVIGGYENRINEVVSNIKKNPMDYNKYADTIRTLGRDINKDWSMGEISKIEANRKAYTDYSTQLDEAVKKNPDKFSPNQIDLLKQRELNKYKQSGGAGYNPQSGIYNQFSGEDALQLDNVTDTLNKNVGKYIKADSGEQAYLNNEGKWMLKTHKGEEAVSREKLEAAAQAYLQSSPELVSAIKQRTDLGIQGFEDPLAYLQDSVNSFVLANEYKKESITKDANVNPYYMKEYEWNHAKQEEQEDTITYFTEDKVVGTGGRDWNEFVGLRNNIMTTIDNSKQRANQKIKDSFGYKNDAAFKASNPTIYNRIQKGDFSDILKLPGGKDIANEYRQAHYNLAGQEALLNKYKKQTGKNPEQNKLLFNTWLEGQGTISVDRALSWKDFDVTTKQIDQVAKRVYDDKLYLDSPLNIPKGTIVKIGGKNIDLGSKPYTMNELMGLGIVESEQVKVPILGQKAAEVRGKDGNVLIPAQTEIQYRLTDGTGTIGFKTGGKGIVPSTSFDDEGKLGVGMAVNIRGKNFVATVNDVQTQSMIDYKNKNSNFLKTKLQLEKWSNSGDINVPNTGGAIYHSEDVMENGRIKYKKGDITIPISGGKRETFQTTNPAILEKLSNWLYK